MKQKVYLAIPNYNMGPALRRLLTTVVGRGYDHIEYVLDDCSTDDSKQVDSEFKGVTFSSSSKNIGAGATRNRILDFQTAGIVHFLDADMELVGKGNVTEDIAAAFIEHPDASVISFRIRNPDGSQFEYNFGPPMRMIHDVMTVGAHKPHGRLTNQAVRRMLTNRYGHRWDTFWTYMKPERAEYAQEVGSLAEGNMAIRLEDFGSVGGFDVKLRYHEIASLAHKLQGKGKKLWYVPRVPAINHNDIDVRFHRKREMILNGIAMEAKRLAGRYKR